MSERIEEMRQLVEQAFHCKARHSASKPIWEVQAGEVVWDGVVETFDLKGHPRAKRCHAFRLKDDRDPELAGKLVLELPPVDSPETALTIALAASAKSKGK